MITDDEIAELPEDPELAFVEFERILRARVQEKEAEASEQQFGNADPWRLEYINKVAAAARTFKIDGLQNYEIPKADSRHIGQAYEQFTADVDHYTMQIRLRRAPVNRRDSVRLDGNTKAKIHHYIGQIREVIEAAELPDEKRDTLYAKLNRFALEVDKVRTPFQGFAAISIGVCAAIGDGFEKLEPARRWVDSVANLLGKAKDVEDSFSALPAPAEARQISSPQKQITGPASKNDLDDEIPF